MADSVISVHMIRRGLAPASAAARFLRPGQGTRSVLAELEKELLASGTTRNGKLIVRVDGSTGAAATQTITMAQASCTAGDKILITVPGYPTYVLTGKTGTAVAANGEYSIDTSNSAVATSVAAAINGVPGLKDAMSASPSAAVVTVTASDVGTFSNGITLGKNVTTGAAVTFGASTLAGGLNAGRNSDVTVTFGAADITANDTVKLGAVTFTWKASAANENEITLSTTETVAATNFIAAVNAHSKLKGLVVATADSSTIVRLTFYGDSRAGNLITSSRTETNSGSVTFSAAQFGSGTTESYGADPRTFPMGAP